MNITIRDKEFVNPQIIEIFEDEVLVGYLFIEGKYKYSVKLEEVTEEILNFINRWKAS